MDEHVLATYRRAEEVFVGGHGATLRDEGGREYLDFFGGVGVCALGHAHPELVAAIRDQSAKLLHTCNLYRHPYTEKLAERLARLTGLEAVFFSNSGAEAVEAALKIARKFHHDAGEPGRSGIVALEHGFHGRTCGALAVTHDPGFREPFEPLLPGVRFVPGDDEDALAAALRERPAALILEPIQGEGGVRELSGSFLRRARALCDETATVLIHDEVQCGAGRTGTFRAAAAAGVRPDVVALAKPLAGGLPMGATLVRRELAATLGPGDHGSTFGGGPLACRAALVMLDALADGLQENVRARGAELGAGLERIAAEFETVLEVRGRGLMRGLRLSSEAAPLRDELYRAGLLVGAARDVLRFLPPYVITATDVERALELVRQGLRDVSQP